jgi:hypothetical protein
MKRIHFAFICLAMQPLLASGQSPEFNRFTEELPQLLETDAATVMVRGLTHDFANKLCARLGGSIALDVDAEVITWKKRNDPFISGAAKALNEIGDRYLPVGGEPAKQGYFQMILRTTTKAASERVLRQMNGANLDNNLVPPQAACAGLARMLREGAGDFSRTPEVTRALVQYMQQRSRPVPKPEAAQQAIEAQLPKPPEGFEWKLYQNAVFLKPKLWNERTEASAPGGIPMTAYASSPEDFSDTKQFEMGMTLQIISGSQKTRGIEAKKMVFAYLKPFIDAHKKEDVLMFEQKTQGDFERTYFRYKDAPPGLKPLIVHKFILANNVTDSVHVFTFESPAELWNENWASFGTPILSKINILPNAPPN